MTMRLITDTDDGVVISEDFAFHEDGHTTPVTVDIEAMQLLGRVAANASHETAERLAQQAEALPVLMCGSGWAAWVRSRRWDRSAT